MATRLYMVANTAPPITPDIDAWTSTTGAVRRMLDTAKAATTEQLQVDIPATAGQSGLVAQFVSPPLAAQTISGTVTVTFRGRELATTDNVNKRWRSVRVVNSAGVTVATLDTLVATASTTELSGTTIQGQAHASASGFTSYACAAGDRLLVAIGYGTSAGGTTPQVLCEWGGAGTDHANANSDVTGTVPWVEFSQNLVWDTPSTTPVSSDLDVRWSVRSLVTADLDARWSVRGLVTADLDARWSVRNQVTASLDVRWSVRNRVTSDLDARWSVRNRITADADLRWSVRSRVQTDLDARWRVFGTATQDADLRWRVLGLVASDVDLRWRVADGGAAQVSSDLSIGWRVLGLVTANADLRWRVRQEVSNGLDVQWRIYGVVSASADLRWRVFERASSDLEARWAVLALAQRDVDLLWRIREQVLADLSVLWVTSGTTIPLLADVFVDIAPGGAATTLDARPIAASLDPLSGNEFDLDSDRYVVDLEGL